MRFWITIFIVATALGACRSTIVGSGVQSFNSERESAEPAVVKIKSIIPRLDEFGDPIMRADGSADLAENGCTGTAIAPDHLLTAAHCVVDSDRGGVAAKTDIVVHFADGSTARSIDVFIDPNYLTVSDAPTLTTDDDGPVDIGPVPTPAPVPATTKTKKVVTRNTKHDLAIVKYRQVFSDYKKMASKPPVPRSSTVKMIGYGMLGFYGAQYKDIVFGKAISTATKSMLDAGRTEKAQWLAMMRKVAQKESFASDEEKNKALALHDRYQKALATIESSDVDEASGIDILRSGTNKVAIITSSLDALRTNGSDGPIDTPNSTPSTLVLTSKYDERAFADDVAKKFFSYFKLYLPPSTPSEGGEDLGAAGSFGDSGGPLTENGHIVGVQSHVYPDTNNKVHYSAYVNLHGPEANAFFGAARVAGMKLPEVARNTTASSSTPVPGTGQGDGPVDLPFPPGPPVTPGPRSVPANNNMAVALGSVPSQSGIYHLAISIGQTMDKVWVCENTDDLNDCVDNLVATTRAYSAVGGPMSRQNWQTEKTIDITKPFVVMTRTSDNAISGVILKGVRK